MLLDLGIIADVAIVEENHQPARMGGPERMINAIADLLMIRESTIDMERLREIMKKNNQKDTQKRPYRTAIISWQPIR